MRVVLISKNDCAEKSEVTSNEMLHVIEPNVGPLAIVHLQPVMQVNRVFKRKIVNWMDPFLQRGICIQKRP
jgi:hypothetical protein